MGCVVMPQEQLTHIPPPFCLRQIPWLDVSQIDEFHQFLLVSWDSASPSSSLCYQIVVRETENRQLLHFFLPCRGNLRSLMCSNGGWMLSSRCPVLAFFTRAGSLAGGGKT